eukprot:SAG31_NODE_213_length_20124_cov_17.709613_5_plen_149_part_00
MVKRRETKGKAKHQPHFLDFWKERERQDESTSYAENSKKKYLETSTGERCIEGTSTGFQPQGAAVDNSDDMTVDGDGKSVIKNEPEVESLLDVVSGCDTAHRHETEELTELASATAAQQQNFAAMDQDEVVQEDAAVHGHHKHDDAVV